MFYGLSTHVKRSQVLGARRLRSAEIEMSLTFEWDKDKNESNIDKHGLDFGDAADVFDSPMLVALDTRQDYGEDR